MTDADADPAGGKVRHARDMDADEYRSAKAAIIWGQRVTPAPFAADAPNVRTMTDAEYRAARLRLTGRRW